VSRPRWLLTLLSFAAAIGASVYVVAATWPAGGTIALPWPAHALALGAALAELGARALKLTLSARALAIPLPFQVSLRTCLGGDFAAAVTPSRSGSEPARYLILSEAGTPTAGALLVLFSELALEAVSLAVVAAALVLLVDESGTAVRGLAGAVGAYAAAVIATGAAGVALARRNAQGPPPAWVARLGLRAGRWRTVQRALRQLRGSVRAVRAARPGLLLLALAASVAHIAARAMILPAIVLTAFPAVALAPLVVWPLAIQYGGVVAPAPGGGGLVEVAFATALGGTIPARVFGASLVWWRFYTFYIYVLLGALVAGGAVLRALRGESRRGATAAPPRRALRRSA